MTPDRNPREPQGRHPESQRPPMQGPYQQPPMGQQGRPPAQPPGGQQGRPPRGGTQQPPGQQPPAPPRQQQQAPTGMQQQAPTGMQQQAGGMAPTQQPMQPPGAGRMQPRPQLQPVSIDDIVQTDVVTAQPDTPISEVVGQMAQQDVGSVVVVEEDRPTGILTDRKIALALQDQQDLENATARDLLDGRDLTTGSTDMSVFDALQQISDAGIRRLPIVDDGELQGIVTLDDLLVLLGSELNKATEVIRKQSPRY